MNAKQARFVDEYLRLGHAGKAAEASGLAYSAGSRLFRHPAVSKAIYDRQSQLREKTDYNVVAAMREAEIGMDFARETRNANAYIKAVELRSKLMGLLVEKLDVRQLTNFRINILGMPGSQVPEAIAAADISPFNPESMAHTPMLPNPEREVEEVDGVGDEAPDALDPDETSSEDIFGI